MKMIHYHCTYCEVEIGELPLRAAKKVLSLVKEVEDWESRDRFLTNKGDGELVVHCICEQCEKTLQQFPHYYALDTWLQ